MTADDPTRRPATPSPTRRYLAAGIVGAALVPLVVLIAAFRTRLPDPLPTHWIGSRPDGFSSLSGFIVGIGVLTGGVIVAAVIATSRRWPRPVVQRGVLAGLAAISWSAVTVWLMILAAAVDDPIGTAATLAPGSLAWLVLGPAAGLLAWWVFGAAPEPAAVAMAPDAPRADLGMHDRVVWTTRFGYRVLAPVAVAVLAAAVVLALVGAPWPAPAGLAVAALACAALSTVRLVVDRLGLGLRIGPLGWPRKRIPLARIRRAVPTTIVPMAWGGWGYQKMPGKSALVLRAGPGLVIEYTDGHRFAVTVDDPQTPAALLNALVTRARS